MDELVGDIEDTQAHPIDDHSQLRKAFHGDTKLVSGQHPDATTQSNSCINDVLEDVTRQLSIKFDLHDNWSGV